MRNLLKITNISALCISSFLLCNLLHAQDNLSEEWEEEYFKRQPPDKIMAAIGVKPGMVIGEVGAGRGRFTVYIAREVGQSGKVYANDIDEKALSYLKGRAVRQGFHNIETITGRSNDPRFMDSSLDMAIMVLVFHMIERPDSLLENIKSGLKPGACLVIVDPVDKLIDEEFGIDRSKPGYHPSTIRERIEKSAKNTGYEIIRTETFLPDDYIFIFKPTSKEKRTSAAALIRDEITQSGIEAGKKLFDLIKTDTIQYNLGEQSFLNVAYEFYGRRTIPEAIAMLNMGVTLNPESGGIFFSLGEMYLIYGDKEKSRENFNLSLKYDPDNQNTQYVLKNLDEIFQQTHPEKN